MKPSALFLVVFAVVVCAYHGFGNDRRSGSANVSAWSGPFTTVAIRTVSPSLPSSAKLHEFGSNVPFRRATLSTRTVIVQWEFIGKPGETNQNAHRTRFWVDLPDDGYSQGAPIFEPPPGTGYNTTKASGLDKQPPSVFGSPWNSSGTIAAAVHTIHVLFILLHIWITHGKVSNLPSWNVRQCILIKLFRR